MPIAWQPLGSSSAFSLAAVLHPFGTNQLCGSFLKFSDRTIERMQDGCVRTNCLDCLDRTNLVQSTFATRSLLVQLQSFGIMEFDEPSIFDLAIKNGSSARFLR